MSEGVKWTRSAMGVWFTREQVEGAMPNGTRVVKALHERGDTHAIGDTATVLGSISHPEIEAGAIFYFVEWDDMPGVPVGVRGAKLRAL